MSERFGKSGAEHTGEAGAPVAGEGAATWSRVAWLAPVIVGAAATVVLWKYDGAINEAMKGMEKRLAGDVRREWQALQQYGQGVGTAVVFAVVLLLDPKQRARLWDYAAAAAMVGLASIVGKVLMGRPRPLLEDPGTLAGVWAYPIPQRDGSVVLGHSWDAAGTPELWSMPSAHTMWATLMTAFLVATYPRLWPVAVGLCAAVAGGRLVFDAHWASDVAAGVTVAWLLAYPALAGGWGQRLAGRISRRSS